MRRASIARPPAGPWTSSGWARAGPVPDSFPGYGPNVYLTINYTGRGLGLFTYVIGWDRSTCVQSPGPHQVLVSPGEPFTDYLSCSPGAGSQTITVQVYKGGLPVASQEVYSTEFST